MTITPLGTPAVWVTVMTAAGHRCHCTGACGSKHSKSGLQCDRDTDREHLLAAPADLLLTTAAAAAVPAAELLAWCADCHRKATARQRAAERERRRQDEQQPDSLF
ncbi:hypothetical protein [Streptomyces sp. NPDC058228]|uniref:hypothetical protein n=1 Tax=Streptomyces sp. NPDC058228 TaxID=3346390 RepID=UPI0036E2473D